MNKKKSQDGVSLFNALKNAFKLNGLTQSIKKLSDKKSDYSQSDYHQNADVVGGNDVMGGNSKGDSKSKSDVKSDVVRGGVVASPKNSTPNVIITHSSTANGIDGVDDVNNIKVNIDGIKADRIKIRKVAKYQNAHNDKTPSTTHNQALTHNNQVASLGYQAVLAWFVLLIFVITLIYFTKQMAPNTVVLEPSGLTASEISQVQTTLDGLDHLDFYKTDLQALASNIGVLSWVHDVRVVRDWQKGIVVSVLPKVAIANFGSEQLLSSSGEPFVPANVRNLNNPKLITVYGDVNHTNLIMQQTYRLNHWFAPLGIAVQDVILTPRQTWLIRFDNGLRLMVDYEQVDEKLHQLSRILTEKNLPIALDDIAMIDLRYQNGFSITKKTV